MKEYGTYDNEEIKALKRQIIGLKARLEQYEQRLASMKGGCLLRTENIDLYPGEQLDFVLSILEQARPRCPEGSRARDIIDSILCSNKAVGCGEEILTGLNRIFKKGNPDTEADIAALRALGFTYTPSRKHPKLRFHEKYMVVLPASPGDSRRGGMNSLSEISKCIAISQKI